ncbi:winged helix DNA-binding protein [Lactococcus garvieae]|jgi:DNA-binding MarR family transcriptional regulator|uniref:winged helix DNA-binding protein n=1 Tax=Lactococcus garvieae TaxID=1363 RepID=UPI0018D9165E|nr:winged helix DNA-binding protein [Lactococcus garvieae]QPS70645.1 MarR family transcriptional regulator [Lactococcus garvieae]
MKEQEEIMLSLTDLFNKMDQLRKPQMVEKFQGYSFLEIACIEFIAKLDEPNVTKLADQLYVTRGAISKATKKLLQKEDIATFQKADNKKEIYFKLTAKGKKINQQHEQLHDEFLISDQPVFESFSSKDLDTILQFTQLYNEHLDKELRNSSK